MMKWTAEQILAMAPDAPAAAACGAYAARKRWVSIGCDARALWGECRGSGSRPYQVQIDLTGPAFKCSCPSRKFPCKHAVGLFLFCTAQGPPVRAQPAWVAEWILTRDATAES